MEDRKLPPRKDGGVIIHFDYDCFYAAVCEAQNPSLRGLPFAVQQKHIIVTCNYEARRRGLHKLQLVADAKRKCPDVIIELGEDLTRFRDASKELYQFIKAFSWEGKVERLGFDEVWLDATSMIDSNLETINRNDLEHSFFQISREDPTVGFEFDATLVAGHTYPKDASRSLGNNDPLHDISLRLRLGSHLAMYMRHQLEQQKGYTSTVGIATNKLTSKLVGNLNKPKGQTTLMPPLDGCIEHSSNVLAFMDDHEIGKVPGIGYKLAQKLREFVLQRPAEPSSEFAKIKEYVTVAQVRTHPGISPESLETLLRGPGSPLGIGKKIWCLLHGIDDAEVSQARPIPRQISIEDSYIRLTTMPDLLKEMNVLSRSLIKRMRTDLLRDDDDAFEDDKQDAAQVHAMERSKPPLANKVWAAYPKTLRLTTRPRQPLQPDGTRMRTMKRISHSGPLPTFVFGLSESIDALAEKLVTDVLISMFRKLHPEKAGWNLSLVNVAVTNIAETAGETRTADGRHIGNMFRRQDDVLKDFKVVDVEEGEGQWLVDENDAEAIEDVGDERCVEGWDDADGFEAATEFCSTCSSNVPAFAMVAHRRFHLPGVT